MLVRDIEIACRNLLLQHLDAGEDSVGTRVEIDHIGATLLGMRVDLTVRLAEVNGRAVVFEVEGRDAVEPIVRGRHSRFVVDVAKTAQRLAAKAQKAGAGVPPDEVAVDVHRRQPGRAPRAHVLLPVRGRPRPAHGQGRGRRGHRGRAELLRGRSASGRRQGLRQGLSA